MKPLFLYLLIACCTLPSVAEAGRLDCVQQSCAIATNKPISEVYAAFGTRGSVIVGVSPYEASNRAREALIKLGQHPAQPERINRAFRAYLPKIDALLLCRGENGALHCVYWNKGRITDPDPNQVRWTAIWFIELHDIDGHGRPVPGREKQ